MEVVVSLRYVMTENTLYCTKFCVLDGYRTRAFPGTRRGHNRFILHAQHARGLIAEFLATCFDLLEGTYTSLIVSIHSRVRQIPDFRQHLQV